MAMGSPSQGQRGAISEINVTPLVDVMLVLLIIFMITATLIKDQDEQERSVEMNLPVTRDYPEVVDIENTTKLILNIDDQLRVSVSDVLITDCSTALADPAPERFEPCFNEIFEKLGQNQRLQDEGEIYILADTSIPYGFVVGTLARIRMTGVNKVGMITNPEYLPAEPSP